MIKEFSTKVPGKLRGWNYNLGDLPKEETCIIVLTKWGILYRCSVYWDITFSREPIFFKVLWNTSLSIDENITTGFHFIIKNAVVCWVEDEVEIRSLNNVK